MPHQNPNVPTSSPFMGWANPLVGWRETQQQNSPETVLFQPQRQAEPQEHEPEPPLVVTPPLMHAAKGVMRSMRRLLELLVDVTFIIEKAPDASSKASKDEIVALLNEARHLSQQTLDKAVEQQIIMLLKDVNDPNLSPQRKKLHGTPIYDATTYVGLHPINASPHYYNAR